MKILELDHVALYVADTEKSIHFYGEILEWKSLPRPAFDFPGAWFRLGSVQELHLIGRVIANVPPVNTNDHFALRVDDIAAWEQHLRSVGTEYRPKKQRPDGAWQIFLRDPDGHIIELFTF